MTPATEILLMLLLILGNGLFAMTELALVSARKARLQQMADDGDRAARRALEVVKNPNRMFSTVQVGISLIGILTGAVGGTTLAAELAPVIAQALVTARAPALVPYSQAAALAVVVLIVTYFSLVIGELIPKRLALNNPERIARVMAGPMRAAAWMARPIVALLSISTDLGLRLLGARPSRDPLVTEEEIRVLLEQGAQTGIIAEAEQDLFESVFRLGDRRVDAIMTPRTAMTWLNLDEPDEKLREAILSSPHAQYPVAQGSLDNILGILNVRDLLEAALQAAALQASALPSIRSLLQPPIFVPGSTPALKVLDEVKKTGLKLALVLDEYGGISGMVTQVDILESLVGEIAVSGEPFDPEVTLRDDGSWLLDGLLAVDQLKEILDVDELPDQERAGYQTLGGLVMSQIGEIPSTGNSFDWKGFRFEVVDMDGRRVDKVLVIPPGNPPSPML
jgi:putative hemolysin